VPAALELAQTLPGEIMICGGQRIYEETLPLADRILLTLVHTEVPGDTWFPEWRDRPWRERWRREGQDENYRYTFSILERSVCPDDQARSYRSETARTADRIR
jgi:dihydrofolate reductase